MCRPKPGPRCSRHTKERLLQAQQHWDTEIAPNYESDSQDIKYLTAKALLNSAKSAYRSSPEGIKELKEKLANADENMSDADRKNLERTLARAQNKRIIAKHALAEIQNGRLDNLTTLIDSDNDTEFSSEEINSILQAHSSALSIKELNAKEPNFAKDETGYQELVQRLEEKYANGTDEQKEALNRLKALEAPDAATVKAYASYEEGLQKAAIALSVEEARMGSLHNVDADEAHKYYRAYRDQYNEKYAHLAPSERPDPPKAWLNTEIRNLSPNTLGDYKYIPTDPASVYAAYRLRSDATSIPTAKLNEAVYASIDLETAGPTGAAGFKPSNGRIIEVGIVKYNNKGEEVGRYSKLMRPEQSFLDEHGTGAEHIHQISVKDLDGQPSWDSVTSEVAKELDGTVMIAQNANFEQSWLKHHLPDFKHSTGQKPVIDTLDISRRHFDLPNHQLKTICGEVGVPYTNGHRATHDAEVTGAAFFKLREKLQKEWDSKPARKNAERIAL